jgi:hypothetical protein
MNLLRRQFLHLAAGAAALPAVSQIATAQTYPSRPITIVIPYAAGGSTDTIGRVMAERMKSSLGQSVIVEDVTGAGGTIAVGRVARAAPDGYTLGLGNNSSHVVAGATYALQYDLLNDFEPVAVLSIGPFGSAHILADQRHQRLVGLAGAQQLHRGNLQSFFEHFPRLWAANLAADVRRMRGGGAECYELGPTEDGLCDRDVGQVPGSKPQIVGDQYIAGRKRFRWKKSQKVLHRGGKRTDETGDAFGGLDEGFPGRVSHDAREIVALAHQCREAGAHERRRRLIHQRDQPTPKQLQFHRIETTPYRFMHAGASSVRHFGQDRAVG